MQHIPIIVGSIFYLCGFLGITSSAEAASVKADVNLVSAEGIGKAIGSVTFTDTPEGLEIVTDLNSLPPGKHGFHIHENGTCEPSKKDGAMVAANAAGGHYDPLKTLKHLGPDGDGHRGDLSVLNVAADGTAVETLRVKNLKAAEIKGRAVMIHKGGDNYSDMPKELGGGGARLACGVIF